MSKAQKSVLAGHKFCQIAAHFMNILSVLSKSMRKGFLLRRRPAKAHVSLGIRAVSPEPLLFTHHHEKHTYIILTPHPHPPTNPDFI